MLSIEKLDPCLFNLFANFSEQSYIYIYDLDRNYSRWSQAAVEFFGLPGEYIHDSHEMMCERTHPDDVEGFRMEMERLVQGENKHFYWEGRIKNAEGGYVWIRCRGVVATCDEGTTRVFVGSLLNLGATARSEAVTGLTGGHDTCIQVEEAIELGHHGAMMLFGLDNFKWVNDMYGYPGGDLILRHIGQEMKKVPYGSFHRMDGDKFLCLLPVFGQRTAELTFSAVQNILENLPKLEGDPVRLTASCGVVRFPEDSAKAGELRTYAEYALEFAKSNRRGSMSYYSPTLHQHAIFVYKLRDALRYAIEHDFEGFWLAYQPLIREEDGSVFGAEALMRFNMPDGQFVSPAEFIPILENDGMIAAAGEWVLRTALAQVREWRKIIPDFCVSVNVSYVQMSTPKFRNVVLDALEQTGISPDSVILELTESCRHSAPDRLQEEFKFFAEHDIRMALDDFGTGYASIDILRTLTPPWIKIDHTFVSSITESQMDEAILEYILQLCRHAQIKVCVEGIENQEVLRIVRRYHPHLLQGYYFSKPLPAEGFEQNYIKKADGETVSQEV